MTREAAKCWRFATSLRRFLSSNLTPAECRRIVEEDTRNRGRNFLRLLDRAVYNVPSSPYRRLLLWAGAEYGDVARLVEQDGVESCLDRLFEAGVHVGLEEFKGRRPIERPGLRIDVSPGEMDNPLLARELEAESSGSTGPRVRSAVDLDLLVHDAAAKYMGLLANGIDERPVAVWRPVPPGTSGLKNALIAAKCGRPLEQWFTPYALSWKPSDWGFAALTACAVGYGRLRGGVVPLPSYVPPGGPLPVSRWLAQKSAERRPGLLCGAAGLAVRVCNTARERGLDISGAVFRVGGEPLTEMKAEAMTQVGASWVSAWAMTETGLLGAACGKREVRDEVHVVRGKVALLQRSRLLSDGMTDIAALYLTTLLPETPKIMLNVDTGDYGVVGERRCGCLLEEIGWSTHLHTIRNYEKLTAGGMHFLGGEVLTLVEKVLPSRHGGNAADYQLVEEEAGPLTRVSILVAPGVGAVEERAVERTVLEFLGSSHAGGRMMAQHWREGRVLRVVRREPYHTAAGKTPPLRIMQRGTHAPS